MFKSTRSVVIATFLLLIPIIWRYDLVSFTTFLILVSTGFFFGRLILIEYNLKTCIVIEVTYIIFYSVIKHMTGNRWFIILEVLIFLAIRALFYLLFWYDVKYFINYEDEEKDDD